MIESTLPVGFGGSVRWDGLGQAAQEARSSQGAQATGGINWKAIGVAVTVLALYLKARATSAPAVASMQHARPLQQNWPLLGAGNINPTTPAQPPLDPLSAPQGSASGQDKEPANWLPWIVGGAVAAYGGRKLVDYLGTAPAPAPAPPMPVEPRMIQPLLAGFRINLEVAPQPNPTPTIPTYTPPVDAKWLTLAPHPAVILVLGKRGSGKSALGYRLLEQFRARATPYVVAIPQEARKLLPEWIGCADRLEDVPPKAIVLLDESYLQYNARDSMSAEGRTIGQLVNLSRQKEQTLIFIVQEARQLDVNAISQADVIAVKELSEISREFERPQLRRFTDKARVAFVGVKGHPQRWTWVYSEAAGEVGLVENELATFWKPALSRAFAKPAPDQAPHHNEPHKGAKAPREELKDRAKSLKQQGHSFGDIGDILGISKSLAFKLVNEPDSPSVG